MLENAVPSPLAISSLDTKRAENRNGLEAEVVSLFDQFREPLLRYLLSFGLAVQDGEEVLQEAFLALFQHLRDGKSRDNLRGWLFRVGHNLALKRRFRVRRDAVAPGEESLENQAVDPCPNPEQDLVNRRARQVVISVLRSLPEPDRRCLSLRAEGLSYREIADVLGMSLGSVSMALTRSLARIARATER